GSETRLFPGRLPFALFFRGCGETLENPAVPSCACGTPDVPLLGDTIGGNSRPHRGRLPRSRGPRRRPLRPPPELDALALGLLGAASSRATGWASGRPTSPSGPCRCTGRLTRGQADPSWAAIAGRSMRDQTCAIRPPSYR